MGGPRRAREQLGRGHLVPDADKKALASRFFLREELLPVGKSVGLEEEAEQHGAVRRDGFVLVAGWPPDDLARSGDALVVLERAFEHVGLLERGMLVQRHDRTG